MYKPHTKINGTCFQGYVSTTYNDLVATFGEPHEINGDKTTANWGFLIDGKVVTIYDWKTGQTPMHLYDWHVGGYDATVVGLVNTALSHLRRN